MNKILVEIYVPSLMKTFEVYIPRHSKVFEVMQLLESAVVELSDKTFKPGPNVLLCDRNSGMIYNINLTVEQIGLKNGSQLLLV